MLFDFQLLGKIARGQRHRRVVVGARLILPPILGSGGSRVERRPTIEKYRPIARHRCLMISLRARWRDCLSSLYTASPHDQRVDCEGSVRAARTKRYDRWSAGGLSFRRDAVQTRESSPKAQHVGFELRSDQICGRLLISLVTRLVGLLRSTNTSGGLLARSQSRGQSTVTSLFISSHECRDLSLSSFVATHASCGVARLDDCVV